MEKIKISKTFEVFLSAVNFDVGKLNDSTFSLFKLIFSEADKLEARVQELENKLKPEDDGLEEVLRASLQATCGNNSYGETQAKAVRVWMKDNGYSNGKD